MKAQWTRPRYFAGWVGKGFRLFRCLYTPTRGTHGRSYGFVYGPYRTLREARHAAEGNGLPIA
jgi:hypothetical protein